MEANKWFVRLMPDEQAARYQCTARLRGAAVAIAAHTILA